VFGMIPPGPAKPPTGFSCTKCGAGTQHRAVRLCVDCGGWFCNGHYLMVQPTCPDDKLQARCVPCARAEAVQHLLPQKR
jgi:hypothetical protein